MKNFKKYIPLIICLFSCILFSCTKSEDNEVTPDNPTLEEVFVGTYNVSEKVWSIYPALGERYITNERNRTVEIRYSNNEYDFYIDGIWQFGITITRTFNNILYFNVNSGSGYFTNGNTFFDLQGSTDNSDLDHPIYHGSFDGNTGKFQVCYEFINLDPYDGYYLQVFDEGY